MPSTRSGAARLSLAVIIGLVTGKFAVAYITGSVSILAQALDSLLDLFAVTTTFLAVRVATKPADEEHPFGHGKVESIAAVGQGVLLFAAAGGVIYSAISRIFYGSVVEMAWAGVAIMGVSIATSLALSRYLLRVARETGSIALEANAYNIAADVYTTAGVLVGLLIIQFTRFDILDPIIALVVAAFIIRAAYQVMRKSFGELIDVRLPSGEEGVIKSAIMRYGLSLVEFHDLRTREAGGHHYVDLHLTMPKDMTVGEAHRISDDIEREIKKKLRNASVIIHVEPCTPGECKDCAVSCNLRDKNS